MQTNPRVVELLNEYLTLELTALNAHFGHSRMCANWGYGRLADKFREVAFAEMKDAEAIVDRVLFFDGLPNLQRLNTVRLGESPVEALRLGLELERDFPRRKSTSTGSRHSSTRSSASARPTTWRSRSTADSPATCAARLGN